MAEVICKVLYEDEQEITMKIELEHDTEVTDELKQKIMDGCRRLVPGHEPLSVEIIDEVSHEQH